VAQALLPLRVRRLRAATAGRAHGREEVMDTNLLLLIVVLILLFGGGGFFWSRRR